MFRLYYILLLCAVFSCTTQSTSEEIKVSFDKINDTMVVLDSLKLDGNKGIWLLDSIPFNGYGLRYHKNDSLSEKIGFAKGKKEGVAKNWYANGTIKKKCYYKKNILVNEYKTFYSNGYLALQVVYNKGKRHGEEKSYRQNGQISKLRNLNNGKENGLQKAWLENGTLYVNYEAKEGRIFGLRRANSCYNLQNEKVIRYDEIEK